jgi:hypothetical protein
MKPSNLASDTLKLGDVGVFTTSRSFIFEGTVKYSGTLYIVAVSIHSTNSLQKENLTQVTVMPSREGWQPCNGHVNILRNTAIRWKEGACHNSF